MAKVDTVTERLAAACRGVPDRMAWFERLPETIAELQRRWSLSLGPAMDTEGTRSWLGPALREDGSRVVLKLGMPHMEAADEIAGLRFWNGDPTVQLLDADSTFDAMLLERCQPGTSLRDRPEAEQDVVVAGLLHRLWRMPPGPHPFRPLSLMIASWMNETLAARPHWRDPNMVRAGLRLFEDLAEPSSGDVLLATDLHAGNVLRAQREPWLAIDPKPFIGDRAY